MSQTRVPVVGDDAYQRFLEVRRADLQRMARRTRGEYTPDDLASEAWLVGMEIAAKRASPFMFCEQEDQDILLAWMFNRFVKYADKSVRFAKKLDHGWDDDSEAMGATLTCLLAAPRDFDPQVRHEVSENARELIGVVQRSYTQAAAYALLLIRVDWDLCDLADLLWITLDTLRKRLKTLGLLARIQPSLFDGVDMIDPDFIPWRRRCLNVF